NIDTDTDTDSENDTIEDRFPRKTETITNKTFSRPSDSDQKQTQSNANDKIKIGNEIENMGESEEEEVDDVLKDETLDLMSKNYSYPEANDPNIQYKIYKMRQYY